MNRQLLLGFTCGLLSAAFVALCVYAQLDLVFACFAGGLIYATGVRNGWNLFRSAFELAGAVTDEDRDV